MIGSLVDLRRQQWTGVLGAVVVALVCNAIILWGAPSLLVFAAGFTLAGLLPGFLLIETFFPGRERLDEQERGVLSVGAGYVSLIVGSLVLHYLPGPLTRSLILLAYDAVILLLLVPYSRRRRTPSEPVPGKVWLQAALIIAVAAFFRLVNLGYSEFQGDEARALLFAAGTIRGQGDILFLHKKGPVEALLPAVFYALHGTIDEFIARLPFALAGLAGVLSIYVLARRLFPRRPLAAPIAAGLLAVDGYLVAFGRIVQYQSVVFLMVVLAAWCFYLWYREPQPALTMLGVLFVAVGTLAHYEAVLVAPFLAWLFLVRGWRDGWSVREWIRQAVGPALVLAVVAGMFYVPFVRDPHFSQTAEYITERRIGGELLYNNLGQFFDLATFYNSTYYIVFLILGVLGLVVHQLWESLRPARVATAVGTVLGAGLLGVMFFPQALVVQGINLAFLPFAVTLAALILAPRISAEFKATFLWLGVPFIIAGFLTLKPNTHFYTMFPAWALLVGAALSQFIQTLDTRFEGTSWLARVRGPVLALSGVVVLAVFGYYVYIVFVRYAPDYRREYPATRPAFYPVVYGDQVPEGGVFGFPHRGGWKAVGALYAQGVLDGSYSANEEPLITSWYTRQAAWCRDNADYYFITSVVHDIENIPVERIRAENDLFGRVWSEGRPILEIYSRQPVEAPVDYDLAELEPVFDGATNPDLSLWALEEATPRYRVDARLGDQARLVGFDAPQQVAAGADLPLVLYWEPLTTFDRHYNAFAHIEVEGERIWGQDDSTPACGRQPTTGWQPGLVVVDSHSLLVDPATPPGDYPLLVGLYDPNASERLPVAGQNANQYGNAVNLGTVTVIPPSDSAVAWEARP